ncbi:MAG: histidine kinase [Gemmatimonadetes bacterium]|nr:MAG: histidine kinase [Gemmatimonadota bacterium]
MEGTSSTAIAEPYREARHIRLMPGPGELAAIVAFWAGYALLTLANRIFDQGGPSAAMNGRIIVAAVEAVCWIILTPILFAVVGRFDLESSRSRRDRWLGLFVIALVTIASAALLGLIGRELRELYTPFPGRGGRGGGRGGPPDAVRLWFGFFNSLVLALGVVATGVARAYSLRLRSRRDQAIQLTSQLAEARLDALRRQLDPHFLFNTLNAIASLVERDPRGVRRMIARLGDLLRHSFEGGQESEVTLRRELALLDLYVDIVKVRFQDRLIVDIRIDDTVLDALVPTFILQPLVENAVKHGVERRTEGGRVTVEGRRDGDALVLCVINDAPAEPPVAASSGQRTGVGIRNTRARLEQLYGARQRFTLERNTARGVVAEVRLPFHVGAPVEPRISGPQQLAESAAAVAAQRA